MSTDRVLRPPGGPNPRREETSKDDPNVCHAQAVVKGTRVMVSVVLDALADGMSEAEIMGEYPTLTVEGIRAAAAYGAYLARDEYPAVSSS